MTETTENKELLTVEEVPAVASPVDDRAMDFKKRAKKRTRKKIIILIIVLVVVALGVWYLFGRPAPMMPSETIALQKGPLANSISLTGTVESATSYRVYSELTSSVKSVNVKVGDYVEEGDLLAQLDTSDLELSIAQQQADINKTLLMNANNREQLETSYENAQFDVKNNLNQQLISAESALAAASQNLNEARRDYNETKDDHEYGDDIVNKAKKEMDKAKDAQIKAQRAYDEALKNNPDDKDKLEELQKDLAQKTEAFDSATDAYYYADKEYGDQLSLEGKALRDARTNYQNALATRDAVANAVQQELDSYQNKIKANGIEGDITYQQLALKKLQKQMSEASLTAPISGTVTAVYAKEGAPGGGLMFVIEDVDALVIKTKLKEYDVATVKEGMPATIKADATGDAQFEGEVSKIYPAAVKSADGSTQEGGSVEFETEVALLSANSGLRVGMNARLNIVTQSKDSVFSVPFDAVIMNAQGQEVVYVARQNEEGKMIATEIPVTTGMETDFYLEINSDQLADGDLILTTPATIVPGQEVLVAGAGMGSGQTPAA